MPESHLFQVIFHYQVLKWTDDKIRPLRAIIRAFQIILGTTFNAWMIININMFANLGHDIQSIIRDFQDLHPALYPLSRHETCECLATIMSLAMEINFNPMPFINDYPFDFWTQWPNSELTDISYRAWCTNEIHFDTFIGAAIDVLRKWNFTRCIRNAHITKMRPVVQNMIQDDWDHIPFSIALYILPLFPEVVMHDDFMF